jgi:hypothetical protein
MTRLQAIRHFRKHKELSIRLLGVEDYMGKPHYFTCRLTRVMGSVLRASFQSDRVRTVFIVRKLAPKQVLNFVRRHFKR